MHRRTPSATHLAWPLLILAGLPLAGCSHEANGGAPAAMVIQAGRPRLEIDATEFNAGEMDVGQKGSHDFLLRNEGDADLEVHVRGTSCTCTLLSTRHNKIAPGETMKVRLEWEALKPTDMYDQGGALATNDPANPHLVLKIRGRVRHRLHAYPESVIFNEVRDGQPRQQGVLVFSQQFEQFEIERIESNLPPELTWELGPARVDELAEALNARSGHELFIRVASGLPRGTIDGALTLHVVTPDGKQPQQRETLSLPVRIERVSDLLIHGPQIQGTLLSLGAVTQSVGHRARAYVIVRGEHHDCELLGAECDPDFLRVTIRRDERITGKVSRFELDVEVPPDAPLVDRSTARPAKVVLKTTHPHHPTTSFQVDFTVIP